MATNSTSIRKYQMIQFIPYLSCFFVLFVMRCYGDVDAGTDTLLQGQELRDGEYLISANKMFRLQFFNRGTSNSTYLGIFYSKAFYTRDFATEDTNPVWVANRDAPVPDPFATLMIDASDGLLKISYRGGKTTVSNTTPVSATITSATIQDNGNLVLRMLNRDGLINQTLWQSFDYPSDTLLPGMKLGVNFKTGQNWSLTSWTSDHVPASGSFTLSGDTNGSSQLMIWWQRDLYWTSGPWQNGSFRNTYLSGNILNFTYVSNESEKYFTYFAHSDDNYFAYSGQDDISFLRLGSDGIIEGNFESFQTCSFSRIQDPRCVREMLPECREASVSFQERRGFIRDSGYPHDQMQTLSWYDCKAECIQNCSCVAYTIVSDNGARCKIFKEVTFFSPSEEYGNVTVYFLDHDTGRVHLWRELIKIFSLTLLLLSIFWCIIPRNFKWKGEEKTAEKMLLQELADTNIPPGQYSGVIDKLGKKMKNQVHLFSFASLKIATNDFSTENKLGQGGFGSVYKGKLSNGQEIAIKRLSKSSGQGLLEFKNEILLIAKLQHYNLVKLLGCCIEGQEKILVYEFMPNRSLDFFLFDPSRRESIKWTNRMNIVEGVAQGLLYLHKYSRLRVIHRDLKASNILLDQNLNPKISDFGMAKVFGKQESEANTKRIVGTQGYMSPEYAMSGVFSIKSDVFSFGVLLLEIVSGKKNHGCYHSERPLNLIGFAWELWVEGRAIELMDTTLNEPNHESEILRCINVGLLCVQDNASDRPSMTDVITMLTNESLKLPEPKQPAFFINTNTREAEKEVDVEKPCTNDLSISVMEGR